VACQDPAIAIRRADAFANSISQHGVEDTSFWSAKASDYLPAYFHAAAPAGLGLRHVARWVSGEHDQEAEDICAQRLAPPPISPRSWPRCGARRTASSPRSG
jgi:hypothetical protein